MKPALAREIALDALFMAVWRRKPGHRVLMHSDHGAQYATGVASARPISWNRA